MRTLPKSVGCRVSVQDYDFIKSYALDNHTSVHQIISDNVKSWIKEKKSNSERMRVYNQNK